MSTSHNHVYRYENPKEYWEEQTLKCHFVRSDYKGTCNAKIKNKDFEKHVKDEHGQDTTHSRVQRDPSKFDQKEQPTFVCEGCGKRRKTGKFRRIFHTRAGRKRHYEKYPDHEPK